MWCIKTVNSTNKILISCSPFITFIASIILIGLLTQDYSSPLDSEWNTRRFVIGMFMFAALTIIPNLLHLKFFFMDRTPYVRINLNHHSHDLLSTHEFEFRAHSICSGCFGSFLGIIFALTIFLLYFVNSTLFFQSKYMEKYLLIGLILILISYSRYFIVLKPKFRLIQHSSLFPGIAFVIVGSDLLFKSAFSMMILLPSWLFFLFGRVYLGKLDHKKFNSQPMSIPSDNNSIDYNSEGTLI
ncbi:MAG: hypothetical protein ACFFAJ_15850 [Candidatus Hodarchaeota archaeon]